MRIRYLLLLNTNGPAQPWLACRDYLARYYRGWTPSWKCSKHYFMALKPIWSSDQHTDHHPGDFGSIQRTQRYVLRENVTFLGSLRRTFSWGDDRCVLLFLRVHPHSRIYDQHTKFSMGQMRKYTKCGWTMALSIPYQRTIHSWALCWRDTIKGSSYK